MDLKRGLWIVGIGACVVGLAIFALLFKSSEEERIRIVEKGGALIGDSGAR